MADDVATLLTVPFEVSQETLEALEWPRVIQRLEALCRTQEARQRLTRQNFPSATDISTQTLDSVVDPAPIFEETLAGVRARLGETDETRNLLDADWSVCAGNWMWNATSGRPYSS